ncbi:hypothetical protein pb186bvf_020334 [Paramecium bursaria]
MFTIYSEEGDLILDADIEEEDIQIKKELLSDLNGFNLKSIQEEELNILLRRIGYVLNQGWKFHSKEKVQLFFGITKLLSCTNPQPRRLIYKILQMTNVRNFIYIVMQSLISDLSSNNQYFKQKALQYIPFLDDEIYILQVDKYIRNALLNTNEYISNQAIILELRLYKKFPQIVNSWYRGIIIEKLTDSTFPNKQHALNFVHEIKKTDFNSFIKIIILLKSQEQTPLVKIQLIRYIGEIIIQKDVCFHKLELEQYLFTQILYQEPIVFIETVRVIIKTPAINNQQLERLIKIIFNQLDSFSNIEAFAVLKLINLLLKNTERSKLIQEEHLSKIKNLMLSSHTSVSAYAILNSIKANKNKNKQIGKYFLQIYPEQEKQEQFNFLNGLLEFVHLFDKQGDQIIIFLQQILGQKSSHELAKLAFKIIEQIIIFQIFYLVDAMRTLFWIAQSFDEKHKSKTIKLVLKYWRNIPLKGKSTQSQFDEIQKTIFQDFSKTLQRLQLKPLSIESKPLEN